MGHKNMKKLSFNHSHISSKHHYKQKREILNAWDALYVLKMQQKVKLEKTLDLISKR